jgi:hypothetical protein
MRIRVHRECRLNIQPDNRVARDLKQRDLRAPWGYIGRSVLMVAFAVCPAIVSAFLAQASADWQFFERSGSITTIIGLLLASRRYFEYRVTDLVDAQTGEHAGFDPGEVLSSILDARRGLTLSAFGTLIWGWGIFLRWWSFVVLALWLAIVLYRAVHDPVLQYRRGDTSPAS